MRICMLLCGCPDRPHYEFCPSVCIAICSPACPSVRSSVDLSPCPVRAGSTRKKLRKRRRAKIGVNVPQSRSNRCANFQLKCRVMVKVVQCRKKLIWADGRTIRRHWDDLFIKLLIQKCQLFLHRTHCKVHYRCKIGLNLYCR